MTYNQQLPGGDEDILEDRDLNQIVNEEDQNKVVNNDEGESKPAESPKESNTPGK